ncbi:MAG: hypothetical protein FWE29_05710 [Defluviitaleaceae bacterium]|nr:hypothetical protein [Defluviitaleaceae bacterium]
MTSNSPKKSLDYDLVYMSHKTGEFLSVHVDLTAADDHLDLVIKSEHLPDISEIAEILSMIRRDKLQKLKFNIWDDFQIILEAGSEIYNVLTDAETLEAIGVKEAQ